MVRDLLDATTRPATGFSPESPMAVGVNFLFNATSTKPSITGATVLQYLSSAETLAETAVSNATMLSSILPCTTEDAACAEQFIATFANRAFRGQLDSTESSALLAVYQSVVSAGFSFNVGIQAILTAVLESPRFLYVLSGKSLLDQSVICWGSELDMGASHNHDNTPFVLIGGGGGNLKPNQLVGFPMNLANNASNRANGSQTSAPGNRFHNDLLLTLAKVMGVDVGTSFGAPSLCTGPIKEILTAT